MQGRVVTALVLSCALGACKSKQTAENEPAMAKQSMPDRACVSAKTWTPISSENAPPIDPFTKVKLDGDKWLVFGSTGLTPHTVAGGIFDACTNTWAAANSDGMPRAISEPAVVIGVGSERRDVPATRRLEPIAAGAYVVWLYPGMPMTIGDPVLGAKDDDSPLASTIAGAIYDVANQKWREIPLAGPLARARVASSVVWTGKELLVWGGAYVVQNGQRTDSSVLADGAAIDPATGAVRAITTAGAPTGRANAAAVWTGTHMFVWGGCARVASARTLQGCEPIADGALYDPVANTWKLVSAKNAPRARINNVAAMAAGKVVVFRGTEREDDNTPDPSVRFDNAFYDPDTDTWMQIPPKYVVGERVIGDYLYAETQRFDGTDIGRIYKVGAKGDWRDVELPPGNETVLVRPDLAISQRPLTGGDSMVPHAPTGVLRLGPAHGSRRSFPICHTRLSLTPGSLTRHTATALPATGTSHGRSSQRTRRRLRVQRRSASHGRRVRSTCPSRAGSSRSRVHTELVGSGLGLATAVESVRACARARTRSDRRRGFARRLGARARCRGC